MGEDNGPWLLPIVEAFGTEYLVDVEQREFRQFNDPANIIKMHFDRGPEIVKACRGKEWHSFGLDTMGGNSNTAGERCGNRAPVKA